MTGKGGGVCVCVCVCECVSGVEQQEITPAEAGEAAVHSVIRCDFTAEHMAAAWHTALRLFIHTLRHQLMGL